MGSLNPFWKREEKINGVNRDDDGQTNHESGKRIAERSRQSKFAK